MSASRIAKWLCVGFLGLVLTSCGEIGLDAGPGDQAGPGDGTGQVEGAASLVGQLAPGQAAKRRPRMQEATYPYTLVAQSDETGELFRAETDSEGEFSIDIPNSEAGNSFVVTVLAPDGRAVGPIVFDDEGGEGVTGIGPEGETSLGLIELPDDPTVSPIAPDPTLDMTALLDADVTTRLDESGVPVGLATHGKGAGAATATGRPGLTADRDCDGLIDVFDADDDGDGIVDDFDEDSETGGIASDVHVNFFMNLKIGSEQAQAYYAGTAAEIADRLSVDTIITFDVASEPSTTRSIVSAEVLETPGPTYLPTSSLIVEGAGGLTPVSWADEDYALSASGDRLDAFVCPNDVMDAGDTFSIDVTFDDGTTERYTHMINYVFKNIPRLLEYGTAAALAEFDVASDVVDGTSEKPIPFDGTEDLVLVFAPPPDETGVAITGMDYTFQIFYNASTDGRQVNGEIDAEATWAVAIDGHNGNGTYLVEQADLSALAADGTYTVTLPSELFVDSVVTEAGDVVDVSSYKIDITAEAPTGNAAIMLAFVKE